MATTTTQTSDAAGERRRARDQRGLRSSQAMKAERLPTPPRQRRPALAALAVLLIVGGAAVAALLAMRVDSRVPVLQANQMIYPGQEITEGMLTETSVAAEDTDLIPADQAHLVYGTYAKSVVYPRQLIDTQMLSGSGFIDNGMVAVGAALPVGRYPAEGLQPGDVVDLVRVTDEGSEIFVRDARISTLGGSAAGGDEPSGSGTVTEISLIVARDDAASVAAANANNQLAVVLVGRGDGIDDSEEESGESGGDSGDGDGEGQGESGSSGEG